MSYFICTAIRLNKETNQIGLRGDDNNVSPKRYRWTTMADDKYLLNNIVGGGIDLTRCNSKFADKVKEAVKTAKEKHRIQYGKKEEIYPYQNINNPYRLWNIGNITFWDKEKTLKNTLSNLEYTSEQYKDEYREQYKTLKNEWDSLTKWYEKINKEFLKAIGVKDLEIVTGEFNKLESLVAM